MTSGTVGRGETLFVRDGGRIVVESNGTVEQRNGGSIQTAQSTLTVDSASGGAGTATLVNGAVAVTGARLKSDSLVHVSYRSMRGLTGTLEVANRVAMDGSTLGHFDIVSSSSEDNSTVSWSIIQPE